MKKILYLALLGIIFTSCQKEEFEIPTNYQFEMTGRTTQDINGYYRVKLNFTILLYQKNTTMSRIKFQSSSKCICPSALR